MKFGIAASCLLLVASTNAKAPPIPPPVTYFPAPTNSFLDDNIPAMGIYETLYGFAATFGAHMGADNTHPWSQGFPLTTPLTKFGGPELPSSVEVDMKDRFYPKAWGHPDLRKGE